jgi:hypothetical protein
VVQAGSGVWVISARRAHPESKCTVPSESNLPSRHSCTRLHWFRSNRIEYYNWVHKNVGRDNSGNALARNPDRDRATRALRLMEQQRFRTIQGSSSCAADLRQSPVCTPTRPSSFQSIRSPSARAGDKFRGVRNRNRLNLVTWPRRTRVSVQLLVSQNRMV